MTHLSILVSWCGGVVEHRLCALVDGMVLGDAPEAAVAFPGEALVVRRDARGWTIAGHRVFVGRPLHLTFGDVEVEVEGVSEMPGGAVVDALPNPVPLVGTLALLLLVSFLDAGQRLFDQRPDLAEELEALVIGRAAPQAQTSESTDEVWFEERTFEHPVGLAPAE